MRLVDYHLHTPLCNHATGSPEEYVRSAIGAGLAEVGFSDHAPLPEHLREGITMLPEETERYLSMIEAVRDSFRGKIAVRVGFEVDYPLHDTFNTRYFTDPRIDYLIGSCHFIDGWGFDNPDYAREFNERDIDLVYRRYFEILGDLVRSGLFNIIGHIDLVKKFGHRATKDFSASVRAAFSSVPEHVAVELNTSGLRKAVREIYPSRDILALLFDANVPVTLGSDSHAPEEVAHEFGQAVELLEKAGYRKISGFEKRRRFDIPL